MSSFVNWALIILGAVLMLIEVLLGAITGFDFFLLGSAILVGGVLGQIMHSAALGVSAAGLLAILYVFVGRGRIRGKLLRPGIPSNTDALLGRTVMVVATVGPHQAGRIKNEGEEWRALLEGESGALMEPGSRARVTRIDGVTVYVVPAAEESAPGGNRQ